MSPPICAGGEANKNKQTFGQALWGTHPKYTFSSALKFEEEIGNRLASQFPIDLRIYFRLFLYDVLYFGGPEVLFAFMLFGIVALWIGKEH